MGVSLVAWVAIAPPDLHAMHPDHPNYAGERPAAPSARPSKYRNRRTAYNGVTYDSKAEANRAEHLDSLKAAGLVREWRRQPTYRLGCPENVYRADFEVVGPDGSVWAEDVKGVETAKFRRDKKLWASYGPHPLKILRHGKPVDVVVPQRAGDPIESE